jgi:hypothetical protein
MYFANLKYSAVRLGNNDNYLPKIATTLGYKALYWSIIRPLSVLQVAFKDEALNALFEYPVRTAL